MPFSGSRCGCSSGTGSWFFSGATSGRYKVNTVPSPTTVETSTLPPDCLAKPNTWDKPSPVPLPTSLVVKKGSKMCSSTGESIPVPVSAKAMAAKDCPAPA
ncbi:hypothetical protein D3C84_1066470 [compost metagenome]